jgi:HD-GYP domain-containing protein (c-di-GMP phosphodiesterase class II)
MFKKIIILVTIITLSVLVMAEIELLTINDANYIETVQARNLRAVKNAEAIRSNIVDLEHNTRAYTYYQNDENIRSFWKTYNTGLKKIDQLSIPIHDGDCKSCHQAFSLLRTESRLISNLTKYGSNATRENLGNSYMRNQFDQHLTKVKNATIFINKQAMQELTDANNGYKILEDKTDYLRTAKAKKLYSGSTKALKMIIKVEAAVKVNDFNKAGQLFEEQQKVFKLPNTDPPLNNDCYSCHSAIKNLSKQAKSVADSAYVVFSTKNDSPKYSKVLSKFDSSLTNYRMSAAKITSLSQIVLSKSMTDAKAVRKRFQEVTTITTTVSMLLILFGAATVIRWTRKRLSVFSTAIKAITEGDYSHTVHITSNDEFADLARTFNIMVSKVNQTQASLKSLHLNTIKALIEAIEAKDPYTRGHSENVARYSMLLGNELGLSPEALDRLHAAALLHDIGKIGIREDVLNKPAKLNSEEYEHIKKHPEISAQIVGSIPDLAIVASILKHHHEHYNGQGYPDGLKGDEIPIESRILSIADTFDAMTSNRPYRQSCSKQKAFSELRKCANKQFDPGLVEVFIKALKNVRIKKSNNKVSKEKHSETNIA